MVRSQYLESRSIYSRDGLDLLKTLGPLQNLARTGAAQAPQALRPHVVNVYDDDAVKPDGAAYHLLTQTTSSGQSKDGFTEYDAMTVVNGYDPIDNADPLGRSSGWVHKNPTTVTIAAGTSSPLTAEVLYDDRGRVIRSSKPGSSASDARTTTTVYYTAGANPAHADCGGEPL